VSDNSNFLDRLKHVMLGSGDAQSYNPNDKLWRELQRDFGKLDAYTTSFQTLIEEINRLRQELHVMEKGKIDTIQNDLEDHLHVLNRIKSQLNVLESATTSDLTKQVRKLGKLQFQANNLQESQFEQQKNMVDVLREQIERQENRITEIVASRNEFVKVGKLEVVKEILPVLDNLDIAFETGKRQVLDLPLGPITRRAIIAWLDGIRLARLRLLDTLNSYDVRPIPSIGQQFNPHCHVAVATDNTGKVPDGVIVSEDRRGYTTSEQILRFAEVIVARKH